MKVFVMSETVNPLEGTKTSLHKVFFNEADAQAEKKTLRPDSDSYWSDIEEMDVHFGVNEKQFKAAAEASLNMVHNCETAHGPCERNACLVARSFLLLSGLK